ncbi:hypothetical protein DXG01_016595 [Tephrocybe rancida]|nr:hypothetical protein DXG01_016595 [Tephrocybe rancida]
MANLEHHFDCTHSSTNVSINCSIHCSHRVELMSLTISLASIGGEAAPTVRLGPVSEHESQGQKAATVNTDFSSALAETRKSIREEQLTPGNGGHFTTTLSDASSTFHATYNIPASDSAPFAPTMTAGQPDESSTTANTQSIPP